MVAGSERAQAFTLEGIVAALVLLASIGFVMQMTAVTPLSSSTSSQQIEGELGVLTDRVIEEARQNGTLKPTLLYWDDSIGAFHNGSEKGYYTDCDVPLPFGGLLERTFTDHGIACNVNVKYLYQPPDNQPIQPATRRLIYVGTPTDHAVRAVAIVTLYDDDVLLDANGTATGPPLTSSSSFYAPDIAPDSRVYNVIQVEVVVWRM